MLSLAHGFSGFNPGSADSLALGTGAMLSILAMAVGACDVEKEVLPHGVGEDGRSGGGGRERERARTSEAGHDGAHLESQHLRG